MNEIVGFACATPPRNYDERKLLWFATNLHNAALPSLFISEAVLCENDRDKNEHFDVARLMLSACVLKDADMAICCIHYNKRHKVRMDVVHFRVLVQLTYNNFSELEQRNYTILKDLLANYQWLVDKRHDDHIEYLYWFKMFKDYCAELDIRMLKLLIRYIPCTVIKYMDNYRLSGLFLKMMSKVRFDDAYLDYFTDDVGGVLTTIPLAICVANGPAILKLSRFLMANIERIPQTSLKYLAMLKKYLNSIQLIQRKWRSHLVRKRKWTIARLCAGLGHSPEVACVIYAHAYQDNSYSNA